MIKAIDDFSLVQSVEGGEYMSFVVRKTPLPPVFRGDSAKPRLATALNAKPSTGDSYVLGNNFPQRVMAQNATNPQATRQRVIAALSQIMGLPLTAAGRVADMRTFRFGTPHSLNLGTAGGFALHVQCPWRIEGPVGIVTGRLDLWEPVEANAPFDENYDYDKSPNLQDSHLARWLADNKLSLVVKSVDADEFGGAAISFGPGFVLRLFPAGTRGEDWRLLRPKTDTRHFVVSGGAAEVDGEPRA